MTASEGSPEAIAALAWLALAGVGLLLSGAPGLFFARRSPVGERIAVGASVVASLAGAITAAVVVSNGLVAQVSLGPTVGGPNAQFGVDPLTAWFALPVFVVGGLAALYSLKYWPARRRPRNGRRLRLCFGALLGAMVFILLARDGVSFLVAWEIMALTNFVAIATEERLPTVRQAGWLFLLYSHVTILILFAFFVQLGRIAGSTHFDELPAAMSSSTGAVLFALAVVAFGIKAGVMPLHSWLPAAHASAPSHVSAVMSGVVIKMGVYGLLRVTAAVAEPPLAWGIVVIALGSLASFFGVLFALSQHDLKRLLAFHSIENVGIILLGLGLALVGRSTGRPTLVVLGFSGCLFHVWNHALFKSLLFLGAGSVVHATGTRDLEAMGGLSHRMPWTAGLFMAGSIAICGLPPGNGFASELLIYLGLVRAASGPGAVWAALAVPVLAATGALAVACFVKVVGVVFSGSPRSERARRAHEAPAGMLGPMAALALACALLGLRPSLVAPALDRVTSVWLGGTAAPPLTTLVPFGWVSGLGLALVAAVGLLLIAVRPAWRRARAERPDLPTWNCGYSEASPRLQYTSSSFAELVTSRFAWALRPTVQPAQVEGYFPAPTRFASHVDDTVLDRLLRPSVRLALTVASWFRALPQGRLQRYIVYLLALLLPLLVWAFAGALGSGG
ncbi:MAG: hydrogenase [Thermoanaerobaculia bacterium]|nr:hydrogenase [Thermoanaerobaculia bacterium]